MAGRTRFQVLGEDQTDQPSPPNPTPISKKADVVTVTAAEYAGLALKILSQRTLQLAGHLFPLIALGLGFYLWLSMPNPTVYQLASLGLYGAFALLMMLVRRQQ